MDNIRPIKTDADYDWAIAEITKYFEDEPEVGSADGDRFDVLATLIEAYEDKHYPIEAPDPVEAIRSHMELFKLPRKALADVLGSSPRATEVLSRRRALTMDMVFKLNKEWHIPAEVLVRPYHLAKDKERKRTG
ncbi:helix-turn-helix domain-containing protein [Mesorhizobium loti]|uniref:helix-turn-helix domain-containing protein n=1 Tax=Rhizobium loti TaxID=381 RepID=UPI0004149768|nr:type II toxin-antitoxin system HigA family antitoxin [Mesorhizobium loti]